MAHQFTTSHVTDSIDVFRHYKRLGERAMEQCPDDCLFVALDDESNCIAIIVKHMVGNMRSRWTDFLTTDGEKPDRHRDNEFEEPPKSRQELLAMWEQGWKYVFDALEPLTDADAPRTVINSHGAAFRDASDQPSDCPLLLSRRPNHLSCQTFRRQIRPMDGSNHPSQEIRRLQQQSGVGPSLATLKVNFR